MSDGVFDPGKRPRPSRDPAAMSDGGMSDGSRSGGSLSARRLREIETLLGVVIDPNADLAAPGAPGVMQGGMEVEGQALELLRAFSRIIDPETRREVLSLVQAAARSEGN